MPCGAVVAIYLSCSFAFYVRFHGVCSVFALSEILETSWRVWQNSSRAAFVGRGCGVAASPRDGWSRRLWLSEGCLLLASVLQLALPGLSNIKAHSSRPADTRGSLKTSLNTTDVRPNRGSRRAPLSATYETSGPCGAGQRGAGRRRAVQHEASAPDNTRHCGAGLARRPRALQHATR